MGGFFLPSPGDVHVNSYLSNVAVAYAQDASNFVAGDAFPVIPVMKQSDLYPIYSKADFLRDEMQIRGSGAEAVDGGWRVTNATYTAQPWALRKGIPDQVRANADNVFNMDADTTRYLTQKALIKREKIFAANAFATGKWGTDITGVTTAGAVDATHFLQWNNPASTPIEDIRTAKVALEGNTGYAANVLVISKPVWAKLLDHPDIVDRVKAGQTPGGPALVSRNAVAALLELDEILVMGGVENTAAESQTGSYSFIGGKGALLLHRSPNPGIASPSGGYIFSWTGLFGANAYAGRIKRYRWEILASDLIEIEMAFAVSVVATDMGYFFASAVA